MHEHANSPWVHSCHFLFFTYLDNEIDVGVCSLVSAEAHLLRAGPTTPFSEYHRYAGPEHHPHNLLLFGSQSAKCLRRWLIVVCHRSVMHVELGQRSRPTSILSQSQLRMRSGMSPGSHGSLTVCSTPLTCRERASASVKIMIGFSPSSLMALVTRQAISPLLAISTACCPGVCPANMDAHALVITKCQKLRSGSDSQGYRRQLI